MNSTQSSSSRGPFASLLSVMIAIASPALAEEDHLKGYRIKDLNAVAGATGVTVTNVFGNETCDLKKPQFFLVQSEKNAGNDPRGGPAGDFVCYKARCTGALFKVSGRRCGKAPSTTRTDSSSRGRCSTTRYRERMDCRTSRSSRLSRHPPITHSA